MEITLTLDEDLVARARECAVGRRTTLESLIAEYLRQITEREAQIEAHAARVREHSGHGGPGYRFNRDECYERSAPD